MPPRRTHTKSRYGCVQCKKRRVKCDEKGPPCSNCISRELECFYSKAPVPRDFSSASTSPNPGYTPVVAQSYHQLPSPSLSDISRAAELRRLELMHKFSTETYQSFCNTTSDFHTWQVVVPQKALHHDFLMKGIFATAALHIASSLEPSAALSYLNTALEYHNQTLTPFRHAIDEISPANCDAVFAHSVVTSIISIALPQLTTEKDESVGAYEKIVLATELLQGVSNILRMYRQWLTLQPFRNGSDFWKSAKDGLDRETDSALNNLSALIDDVADTRQHNTLTEALQLLRQCFTRYANSRDISSILAWLAAADKQFIYSLRCREPLALLILMYWGVLLHELHDRLWWAKGSGSALVVELLAELRHYQPRWENIFLWPKQKIGLQEHLLQPNGIGTPH
ncbi:hypothetical protein BDV18DRAFT_167851 [Aspergillus unguis]